LPDEHEQQQQEELRLFMCWRPKGIQLKSTDHESPPCLCVLVKLALYSFPPPALVSAFLLQRPGSHNSTVDQQAASRSKAPLAPLPDEKDTGNRRFRAIILLQEETSKN
jgi:hypothetical protein